MSDDQPTWRPPDQRPTGGAPIDPLRPVPAPPYQPPPYQPPPYQPPPFQPPPFQPPPSAPHQAPPGPYQSPPSFPAPPPGPGWTTPPPGAPPPGPAAGYWQAPMEQAPRPSSKLPWIVVGVVVAVVVVGLIALGIVFGSGLGTFGTRTPLEEVAVGECFDGIRTTDFDEGGQFSPGMLFGVEVMDCAEEHEAELIARVTWPADRGDAYPGDTIVETFALNACTNAFPEYVGVSYESSRYELTYVYPERASWASGTRTFECIVHPPSGTQREAGSVRDANR